MQTKITIEKKEIKKKVLKDFAEHDIHQQFADFFPEAKAQGYLYLLSKRLSEGHICVEFTECSKENIPEKYALVSTIAELLETKLAGSIAEVQPIIIHNKNIYLQRYYFYETLILSKIRSFLPDELRLEEIGEKLLAEQELINNLFLQSSAGEADWQFAAAIGACIHQFSIITGGPGTGKTTTIAKALAILYNIDPSVNIALVAPTGKAANRMAESLKEAGSKFSQEHQSFFESLVPSTIHRLLGYRKNSVHFTHRASNPLPHDIIIVDETSMMDAALLAKFLDAVAPHTKLILLGDKNQLSAVEAGSIFGDLCESLSATNQFTKPILQLLDVLYPSSEKVFDSEKSHNEKNHILTNHIISLTKSYRFTSNQGIAKFSAAVLNNEAGIINEFFSKEDAQLKIVAANEEYLFENFVSQYEAYIDEPDVRLALKKLNTLKILCATKQGKKGVYALNRMVEFMLQKKGKIQISGPVYHNMPIMISNNNYQLELFNGDTGLAREVDGELRIYFESGGGELISFIPAYIPDAEKSFAITIHKSQGSEYEQVWISLPDADEEGYYSRELLYTAVTRGKQKVYVDASQEIILGMAEKKLKRSSGVVERLSLNN